MFPFIVCIEVFKYQPALPQVPTRFIKALHYHYSKRICWKCGEFHPIRSYVSIYKHFCQCSVPWKQRIYVRQTNKYRYLFDPEKINWKLKDVRLVFSNQDEIFYFFGKTLRRWENDQTRPFTLLQFVKRLLRSKKLISPHLFIVSSFEKYVNPHTLYDTSFPRYSLDIHLLFPQCTLYGDLPLNWRTKLYHVFSLFNPFFISF